MELRLRRFPLTDAFQSRADPYFRPHYRDPGGVTGAKIKLDCHRGLKEIDHASIRLSLPGLSQSIHPISSYRRPNRTQRPVPSVREHERATTSRGFRRDDVEKELKTGKASGTAMLIQPRRMSGARFFLWTITTRFGQYSVRFCVSVDGRYLRPGPEQMSTTSLTSTRS